MTLGQKIKNYRKRAGLSQMDLELAIGASPGAISRIENGNVNPLKETIFEIVDALNLDFAAVADLFNINIKKRLREYSEIQNELSELDSTKDLLEFTTRNLVNRFGVNYSSAWLWNASSEHLELTSVSAPNKALEFARNILGLDMSNIFFDPHNVNHIENGILKTYLNSEVHIHDNFYEVGNPYVNKISAKVMQKLLNMGTSVHVPLKLKEDNFGVLGLLFPNNEISNNLIEELKFVSNQVSREIYYINKINLLEYAK